MSVYQNIWSFIARDNKGNMDAKLAKVGIRVNVLKVKSCTPVHLFIS
jgi:hypothetical protein